MKKLKKLKPVDEITMECGFGCKIIVKTIQKFTEGEKFILFEKTVDDHNEVFHNFKLEKKVFLKNEQN